MHTSSCSGETSHNTRFNFSTRLVRNRRGVNIWQVKGLIPENQDYAFQYEYENCSALRGRNLEDQRPLQRGSKPPTAASRREEAGETKISVTKSCGILNLVPVEQRIHDPSIIHQRCESWTLTVDQERRIQAFENIHTYIHT